MSVGVRVPTKASYGVQVMQHTLLHRTANLRTISLNHTKHYDLQETSSGNLLKPVEVGSTGRHLISWRQAAEEQGVVGVVARKPHVQQVPLQRPRRVGEVRPVEQLRLVSVVAGDQLRRTHSVRQSAIPLDDSHSGMPIFDIR